MTSLLFCVDAINEAETGNRVLQKGYIHFPSLGVDESGLKKICKKVPSDRAYGCRGEGGKTPTNHFNTQHSHFNYYGATFAQVMDDECDGATSAQITVLRMTNVMVATFGTFSDVNPKRFQTTM